MKTNKWYFEWDWCDFCEKPFVRCPKCGNNTCNGGYGTDILGNECDVCRLAYDFEDKAYKGGFVPSKEKLLK